MSSKARSKARKATGTKAQADKAGDEAKAQAERERLGDVPARTQSGTPGQYDNSTNPPPLPDLPDVDPVKGQGMKAGRGEGGSPYARPDFIPPSADMSRIDPDASRFRFAATGLPSKDGRYVAPEQSTLGPDLEGLDKEEVKSLAREIMVADPDIGAGQAYRRAAEILQAEKRFDEDELFRPLDTAGPLTVAGVRRPGRFEGGPERKQQIVQEQREAAYKGLDFHMNPSAYMEEPDNPDQQIPREPIPVDWRAIQEEEGRLNHAASVTV